MKPTALHRWLLLALYVGAVAISLGFSELRYRSLNCHNRDYPFYLQFAARLLDPQMSKTYSLNPIGHNCLFFTGAEGVSSFHQSIHFEPIKYLYPTLYRLSPSPGILFGLASVICFLPVLWLAWAAPLETRAGGRFALLMALLYVLYPSSLLTPACDLRPYVFLAPAFLLCLLSITFSRPLWERLLWFNALFLVREEALILGLFLIGYAWATGARTPRPRASNEEKREEEMSTHSMGSETRGRGVRAAVLALGLSWSFWLALTLLFFGLSGYPSTLAQLPAQLLVAARKLPVPMPLALALLGVAGIVAVAAAVICWRRLRQRSWYPRAVAVGIYGAVFLPLVFQFALSEGHDLRSPSLAWLAETLFSARYMLYFTALLGLVFVLATTGKTVIWQRAHFDSATASAGLWRAGWVAASALVVGFVALDLFSPWGGVKLCAAYRRDLAPASEVLSLRRQTDQHRTWILSDYATYQAFGDYQHVFVYNRLPWQVAAGESGLYPANKAVVQQLLNQRIEYVVVGKDSGETVKQLLAEGGLSGRNLVDNEKFLALRIVRK